MRKRIVVAPTGVRMLTLEEACTYTGLGRNSFIKWADLIGSKRKFGARALYDKKVIDEALDRLDSTVEAMTAAAAQ